MDSSINLSKKKVGGVIACVGPAKQQIETILKAVGQNVHLIKANTQAHANVVLTANKVESIAKV